MVRRSRLSTIRWAWAGALVATSSTIALAAGPASSVPGAPVAPAPPAPATAPAVQAAPLPAVSPNQVTVVELATVAAPAFQATGEQFSQMLTLTYDPRVAPGPLRVEASPLDCDGVTAETRLAKSEFVQPSAAAASSPQVLIDKPEPPVWVVLSGTLPRVTTCTGQLRFKIGTQAWQPRPIRVTRAAPVELPIEVSGLQQVATTVGSDLVTFSMKGLPERALSVKPTLFELGLKGESSDSKLNSKLDSWDMDPKEAVPVPMGATAKFTLHLVGLPPGDYVGKLDLASEGFKSKSQQFSLAVRYGYWLAALLVAIGAGAALLLKRLSMQVRPRLVVRAAVSKLMAQIVQQRHAHALDTVETGVLDSIQARVAQVLDEAVQPGDPAAGWADTARTQLAAEGSKLTAFGNWVNARRMLASITDVDDAKRTAFEQRLTTGRQMLTGDVLDPLVVTDLASLPGDIEEAKSTVALVAATAAAAGAATAADMATSPEAAEAFRESQSQANQASELLTAKNYPGYRAAYDASGRAYYSGLATELESRLPSPPVNGADLAGVHFAPVAPGVRANLAQVRRASDLQTARASYINALEALRPVQAAAVLSALPGVTPAPLREADFPDPVLREQQPLVPAIATTVIEDTKELSSRLRLLDNVVDGVALVSAAALGVLLVWAPNPGWGRPTDLIAALLWGMGLHTVGTSTFEGILGLRSKLS